MSEWISPTSFHDAPTMPYDINILDDDECLSLCKYLIEQSKECAIDTETTSHLMPDKKKGELFYDYAQGARAFSAQFCPTPEHVFLTFEAEVARELLDFMDSRRTVQIYQNCKFDLHHLREWAGYTPSYFPDFPIEDTMFGFRLQYPRAKASLKIASKRFVAERLVDSVDYWQQKVMDWLKTENALREEGSLFGGRVKQAKANFSDVPLELMIPYSAHDAYLTLMSFHGLEKTGITDTPVYREEVQVSQLLVNVEKSGWRIKPEVLQEQLNQATVEYARAMASWKVVCPGINPDSGDEISHLLYNELNEEVVFYSDSGKPAVNEAAIFRIQHTEIRECLLNLRHWGKTRQTLLGLKNFLADDGAIHSNLKNEQAKTGRFGSENPNLQNISQFNKHKPWTHARALFGPEEGFEHLFVDYKQIEVVIFADCSKDPILCSSIINNEDNHSHTTAAMFGLPYEEVNPDSPTHNKAFKPLRKIGKGMTFTIQYGAGVEKIAHQLKYGESDGEGAVSPEQLESILGRKGTYQELAKYLRDRWKIGLPVGAAWMRQLTKNVEARRPTPWIKNKFGRIIPVDPGFEYKALNYLIQGSAADLMKLAMIKTVIAAEEFCKTHDFKMWKDVQLCMSIHDELIWKVPKGFSEKLAIAIQPAMCEWEEFSIPVRVSFSKCDKHGSWATKQDFHIPVLERSVT